MPSKLCPALCVQPGYVHSQGSSWGMYSPRALYAFSPKCASTTSPPFPWSFAPVVPTTPPSNLLILVSTVREALWCALMAPGSTSSCGHSSGGDGPSLLYLCPSQHTRSRSPLLDRACRDESQLEHTIHSDGLSLALPDLHSRPKKVLP